MRALDQLIGLALQPVELAVLARRAEVAHVGLQCGIMDQMASSLAATDRALLIDTRSLERRDVPLPPGSEVLVIDSGSTDGSIEIAESHGATVHLIDKREFSHGGTRNRMVAMARGDHVAFITHGDREERVAHAALPFTTTTVEPLSNSRRAISSKR